MIKGTGYGKLLKQSFFTLLISCFTLLGSSFVNATYQLFQVGLNNSASNWDSQFDLSFLKKGRFISNYLGTSKPLIALNSTYLIWWTPDGGLYTYGGAVGQGYFQYINSCDRIGSHLTGDNLQNCTANTQINYLNSELVGNFISNLSHGDWVFIEDTSDRYACGGYCNYDYHTLKVCFSSESLDRTLCLFADKSSYQGSSQSYRSKTPLTSSRNYSNLNFANINRADLSDPPLFNGSNNGNIDGSSSVGQSTTLTGNVMYNSCTNGYVVSQLSKLYGGTKVCYAGTYDTGLILNGGISRTPVDKGLTFKEVYQNTSDGTYGYYSSYSNWFNSRNDAMYRFKMGSIDGSVFNGVPVYLYTYFSRLYENGLVYNGQDVAYDLLNYCKLALYSDYTSQYEGSYFSSYCSNFQSSINQGGYITTGQVGSVINDNDLEVLPPDYNVGGNNNGGSNTSNGTIVSVDWSGTLTGDTNKNFEGKTFINDFYQKLQANYQKPINNIVGGIPKYIIIFMLAIILFRFLRH